MLDCRAESRRMHARAPYGEREGDFMKTTYGVSRMPRGGPAPGTRLLGGSHGAAISPLPQRRHFEGRAAICLGTPILQDGPLSPEEDAGHSARDRPETCSDAARWAQPGRQACASVPASRGPSRQRAQAGTVPWERAGVQRARRLSL